MHGPDETFVRFLCETVHPVVRSDPDTVDQLVRLYNEKLAADGWSLVVTEEMSGRPVFEGRRRSGAKQPSKIGQPQGRGTPPSDRNWACPRPRRSYRLL